MVKATSLCKRKIGSRNTDSALVYLFEAMKIDPSISILTVPDLLAVRKSGGWEEFESELISVVNRNCNIAVMPKMGHVPIDVDTKRRIDFDYLIINRLNKNLLPE